MKEPLRVIVAEDEFLVAQMVKGMLEDLGCLVAGEALDGEQAAALVCELRPDLVLMDIQMPRLDGIEAARRIQECCPAPIVILTAHESSELVARAAEAGVGAYLLKPPNPRDLERAITVATARHADLMALKKTNAELREALATVKLLSGIVPICSKCKAIRDETGRWHTLEIYIRDHSEADFSHSLCPRCAQEMYPNLNFD